MSQISLNGVWHFTIDQDPEGKHWCYSAINSGVPLLRHWKTVVVPGCWNRYGQEYDLFEGVCWFAREFVVEDLPQSAVANLTFEGVNYLSDVFLNGKKVGMHEGGYTPFSLDVSAAITKGVNRLAVRVDNRLFKTRLPPETGWYNYGGIHRDVSLRITEKAQLNEIKISALPEGRGAKGSVAVRVEPADLKVELSARIMDKAGKCVWSGKTSGAGKLEIIFELQETELWSPANPALYDCEMELAADGKVVDRRKVCFGLRKIEARGNRILLNDEKIYLKGMCHVFDHPVCGMTFDPAVIRADLDDLQALGVNCLRSHFPPPSFVLDECDRRGMMLWMEAPIYCMKPKLSDRGTMFADNGVKNLALGMLREMVFQAINHPAVIIWSVGNECNVEHSEAEEFFRACVEQVRALDNSRLVAYASFYGNLGCMKDKVDVVGINQYWGWYDRIDLLTGSARPESGEMDLAPLEKCLKEKSELGKPLVMSEFSADTVPGYLSSSCELWSENYQALFMERQMDVFARYPAVAGSFPFCYADYRDPAKPVNQYWDGFNLKGLVDYKRRHKMAWDVVRRRYQA